MATFQNTTVTMDMVPEEVKAPLAQSANEQQFRLRLNTGGTMELIDSVWVLGPPAFDSHSFTFAALDRLVLRGKSGIVTNGNTLGLFVNEIESEDGFVIAFSEDQRNAASGQDGAATGAAGAPGRPGISGGLATLHVMQRINGILHTDLSGQHGGDGGSGVAGAAGAQGTPGSPCQAGIVGFPPHPGCKHDGGQGGKGYTGGPGGHGGFGGNAGEGGIFELYNVGAAPIPAAAYTFVAQPGRPGKGGAGGAGGPGGSGGPGGDGNFFCHGGQNGPQGDAGVAGESGANGAVSAPGRIIAKNLDLQEIVHEATGHGGASMMKAVWDKQAALQSAP